MDTIREEVREIFHREECIELELLQIGEKQKVLQERERELREEKRACQARRSELVVSAKNVKKLPSHGGPKLRWALVDKNGANVDLPYALSEEVVAQLREKGFMVITY